MKEGVVTSVAGGQDILAVSRLRRISPHAVSRRLLIGTEGHETNHACFLDIFEVEPIKEVGSGIKVEPGGPSKSKHE
jgi:hypothetical protein